MSEVLELIKQQTIAADALRSGPPGRRRRSWRRSSRRRAGRRPPTTCRTSRSSWSTTRQVLEAIASIERPISETFVRENYEQLSFSEEELAQSKTGILGTHVPAVLAQARLQARRAQRGRARGDAAAAADEPAAARGRLRPEPARARVGRRFPRHHQPRLRRWRTCGSPPSRWASACTSSARWATAAR